MAKKKDVYGAEAERVAQSGLDSAKAGIALGEQLSQDIIGAGVARQEALQSAYDAYNKRISEGAQDFADIIRDKDAEAKKAEAAAVAQKQREQKAAMWTGLGNLAASVANLIGTANGAVSQRYHDYSADWMQTAERNWKANLRRIDNLKAKQESLRQQMLSLKLNNANAALSQAQRNADLGYNDMVALAKANYNTRAGALKSAQDAENTAAGLRLKGEAERMRQADKAEDRELSYAIHGFTKDANGKMVRDESYTGRGSGIPASAIKLTVAPTGPNTTGTDLIISPQALISNINTNIKLIESPTDQKAVERIIKGMDNPDVKAKKLERYIGDSPKLLQALKRAAYKWSDYDWVTNDQVEAAENSTTQQQQQGRPANAVGGVSDIDKIL